MYKRKLITKSSEETKKLGEAFAKNLKGGDVLALYGPLGAGKTTFLQGLAKGLGITGRITSPTFVLLKQYKVKKSTDATLYFYHIDLYRISGVQEIRDLGLNDILSSKKGVAAIEWGEKMAVLPKKRWEINFAYITSDEREIRIALIDG